DWDQYSLEMTSDHWYLRYSSTWESPMSGTMYWSKLHAEESDLGTQDRPQTRSDGNPPSPLHGGHGGSAPHGGGPAAWDWDCGWGVEVIPLQLSGFTVQVTSLGADQYEVVLSPEAANRLVLKVPEVSLYIQPGDPITVDMDVENLIQLVNACQAMLGYSSTYFEDPTGGSVQFGGGVWDELIWDSWADSYRRRWYRCKDHPYLKSSSRRYNPDGIPRRCRSRSGSCKKYFPQ
ncbi:MAG: hypothetical protein ACYTBV_20685, partial [Planctomycetota bacterium]